MGAFSKIYTAFRKYPLLRGMASYSIIWPTSSLIQQTFEGKRFGKFSNTRVKLHHIFCFHKKIICFALHTDTFDYWRSARYGLYGCCYVAPTLYSWLTIANIMWPGNSIRAGIIKVEYYY